MKATYDEKLCTNARVEIKELSDEKIVGLCTNCGKDAIALRKHYSKKQWAGLVEDAKKHQKGFWDEKI